MNNLESSASQLERDCNELEPKLKTEKERLTFLSLKLRRLIAEKVNFMPEREILESGEKELSNCREELQALENEYRNIQSERDEMYAEMQGHNMPLLEMQNRELKLKNSKMMDLLKEINDLNSHIVKLTAYIENSKKIHEENLLDISLNYKPNLNLKPNSLRLLADKAKSEMETAKRSYLETQEVVKELETEILLYQKECGKQEASLYRKQANQFSTLEDWFHNEKEKKELLESELRKEELKLHSLRHSLEKLTTILKPHENYTSHAESLRLEECLQKLKNLKSRDNELSHKITALCDRSQICFRIFWEKFEKSYALISSQICDIQDLVSSEDTKIYDNKRKVLALQKSHSMKIEELQSFKPKDDSGQYRMMLEDMKRFYYVQLKEKFLNEFTRLNFSRKAFIEKQNNCNLLEKEVDELEGAITEFKQKN